MMQPWLCEHMDEWINSKRFTSAQINKMIGTKVTHKLLTAEAMEQTSEKVAELYKAMTLNSIIAYDWEPKAPVYMMHSMDDETVPYTNATRARSHWKDANITYNFGHYGGHVLTCLRFIYTVQELLAKEEAERKIYEY
jgi:predicted alpha/beta hydrolase family esterase